MKHRITSTLVTLIISSILLSSLANTNMIYGQGIERCFSETGLCIAGRIREFWEQSDGLRVFGLPISIQKDEMIEGRMIQVQWFERNRLELHPENAPPYDVLLGRLGVDKLVQQGHDWFTFPRSSAQIGCRFFSETGHNLCGDFLTAWRSRGIELDGIAGAVERESLALFGLPLSDLQTETIDGKEFQVQWFERARFELHPENTPPYNVLLGLLGRELMPPSRNTTRSSGVIAFSSRRGIAPWEIYVINPDGSGQKRVTQNQLSSASMHPFWLPSGSQIGFMFSRTDWEIRLTNIDGSRTTAPKLPSLCKGTWSSDRTPITCVRDNDVYVLNADGTEWIKLLHIPSSSVADIALSPDGTHIAFTSFQDDKVDIYVINIDGSDMKRLTYNHSSNWKPSWSPDGSKIAFTARTDRYFNVYVMNADGSEMKSLTPDLRASMNPTWSPDGKQIAFQSDGQIFVMNADGSNQINLTRYPGDNEDPAWSPASVMPLPSPDRQPMSLPDLSRCMDLQEPISARVHPSKCIYKGDIVSIDIFGFQSNESFDFKVTTPDGRTSQSKGIVKDNGELTNILYDTINLSVGIWEVSFDGNISGHHSVIQFRVLES